MLQEPLEFQCHEIKKIFEVGDHVKVINGKYENDTGNKYFCLFKKLNLVSNFTKTYVSFVVLQ